QLIIAGLAGFIVGQTINAWVVVAIKERTKEKHLWARLVGSTFAGQLGDTLVFCSIAANAIGIDSFKIFVIYTAQGWLYKTAVEVVMLPITYRVIAYIKRNEPTYQLAV
ncbi:MAG: queuosine precursor transporter, partial [Mycobacterium sp.]|nr:queuosine precursor transporter [Mycobacterium sp.]